MGWVLFSVSLVIMLFASFGTHIQPHVLTAAQSVCESHEPKYVVFKRTLAGIRIEAQCEGREVSIWVKDINK